MILYAFVARRQSVLADYAMYEGQYGDLLLLLPADAQSDGTVIIKCENVTVNILFHGGLSFVAVADQGYDTSKAFAFLMLMHEEFAKGGWEAEARHCPEYGFASTFGPVLGQLVMSNAAMPSMLDTLKSEIKDIHGILNANVDLLIKRGQKLDVLEYQADQLATQAEAFQKKAKKIARHLWWQNNRVVVFMITLLLTAVTVAILLAFRANTNHDSGPVIGPAPATTAPTARRLLLLDLPF